MYNMSGSGMEMAATYAPMGSLTGDHWNVLEVFSPLVSTSRIMVMGCADGSTPLFVTAKANVKSWSPAYSQEMAFSPHTVVFWISSKTRKGVLVPVGAVVIGIDGVGLKKLSEEVIVIAVPGTGKYGFPVCVV